MFDLDEAFDKKENLRCMSYATAIGLIWTQRFVSWFVSEEASKYSSCIFGHSLLMSPFINGSYLS